MKINSSKKSSKKEWEALRVDEICTQLAQNMRVRRTLPDHGRLHIDRQLPFLCVYRQPDDREDAGTRRLVQGEASYLIASGANTSFKYLSSLVRKVIRTLSSAFGGFLMIEIWSENDGGKANDPAEPMVLPTFTIHPAQFTSVPRTVNVLERQLGRIRVLKQGVHVETKYDGPGHPLQVPALIGREAAHELNCSVIGIAVPPVYRVSNTPRLFPLILSTLRRSLGLALRRAFFEFARTKTTHQPKHYLALGRRAVVRAVLEVDRRLADVSNRFDYLLQLTPVNTARAWRQFKQSKFESVPEFHYRPLPVDPRAMKRILYRIPIERVEDPVLQSLFQQKQEELELKLTMLRDRDTPHFLYESLQLFGGVEDKLVREARSLLKTLPERSRGDRGPMIDAREFARRAEIEIDHYRRSHAAFKSKAVITDEVSGLIVSRGKLLINRDMTLPSSRADALLAHEVGTHMVTYFNGRAQPFQQLYAGLAGYEELQEGLAVLAEYLVGGLSCLRLRQLAARVVAAHCLIDGAGFVETFRQLNREYEIEKKSAYTITMRIFRGGGLTKDAVYLRGLQRMLVHLRKGGSLEPLLVGKLAIEHIPLIRELQYRKVLTPAPITPRYLENPASLQRLQRLREGRLGLKDLVEE